tara:strand:+ start:345 stop:992 length:648 start_codon:yes stop_codon:yes gene_type:complete
MDFENELIPGVLIKRYKRFFADIKLKNKIITAHCPNSGSMFNLLKEGNPVWFTESKNDKRKLKYTLQIIEVDGNKFCINTHITNRVIEEALKNKLIEDLKKYELVRAEMKFGKNTRFDFFLTDTKNDKKAFLEVKSVSLSRKKGHAEFPDAVTERGKKHLENLILAIEQGFESYLIFLIQIEKCKSFNIASDIDPVYFEMLKKALKKNIYITQRH